MFILFPGRHHLLTNFQLKYLKRIISSHCEGENDVNGKIFEKMKIDAVIFAVTSANHSNTRRNPLPFYLRAMALQEFSEKLDVPCFIYGVDDVGYLGDFATYTLKKIKHESDGSLDLNPTNTLVLCSTPVLEMYEALGFRILAAELINKKSYKLKTKNPWHLVESIAQLKDWKKDRDLVNKIHPASLNIFGRYGFEKKIQILFSDRILGDDGDITETRDYNSYVRQMDEIAELKFEETSSFIQPGRIGDIGCAVGSWIKLASCDVRLRESDFYGIEAARQLYDICVQRKSSNEFDNPFVFFAQKNAVMDLVFEKESMNTIHTSSLTHEIESYGGRKDLLRFIKNRFEELKLGGVWINRDVVGPENKDEIVYMQLNKKDGRNNDFNKEINDRKKLAEYLKGLSTYGKFMRFVRDYRKAEHTLLNYEIRKYKNDQYICLKLKDTCEFISKKDYLDNWQSEMHETFCFWSFSDWKKELNKVGFHVGIESQAYTNAWIVKNRYEGKVTLYKMKNRKLEILEYPETNLLMVGYKIS